MVKEFIRKIMSSRTIGYLNHVKQWREAERRAMCIAEVNRKKIQSLLQGTMPIKLEMGAGCIRGIPGWTYIDANGQCDLNLDLTQPIPFPDDSVDIIYSSHLLEHFNHTELMNLLAECLRILKPGGKFSAAVPDAGIYVHAYHEPDAFSPEIFCRYKQAYHYHSKIDFVNYIAYMDGHHNYMFDEDNLLEILKKAGFRNASLRDFDEVLDLEARRAQTIYAEAEK